MKKTLFNYFMLPLSLVAILLPVGCTEDDPEPEEGVVASFQFEVDETNFLEVTFSNFSQNAASYAWDFGDESGTSTDENPVYEYAGSGTYTVSLTATDADGETSTFSDDVEIIDPDEALTLLAGNDGKTWKLLREGTSLLLMSAPGGDVYWAGSSNDGSRPCMYDDEFTFGRDGSYTYADGGTFWAEYGVFNNVEGCDSNTMTEQCFEPTAANMVNECGDDVSAWMSGTHAYTYDATAGQITLTGTGAWIGIPKLGTTSDANITPQSEVIFDVVLAAGGDTGVDTLYASFTYEGTYWPITYVSYADASQEPNLVSVKAGFGAAANGLEVAFTNSSSGATSYSWAFGDGGTSTEENPTHTYAAEGTYTVTLTVMDDSGASATASSDVVVSAATLSEAAPTPSQAEADVISIYSDAYTDITGVDTNPNWGQATVVTAETVESDNVLLLSGLNYQGIDFAANAQDVSGETMVHIDVWAAADATVNFYLISTGPLEASTALNITGGQWNSFDIALSEYSSVVSLSDIIQFKFDASDSPSIYIDNLYFY